MSANRRGTAQPEPNPPPDVKCDLDATPSREVRLASATIAASARRLGPGTPILKQFHLG